mmetsp:Transcript_58455/g.142951  ORF Transcript_58455/g.142951 Transcript_58455/m.142951 type:complete len:1255 (+) Transcript_58455:215-3979(+)
MATTTAMMSAIDKTITIVDHDDGGGGGGGTIPAGCDVDGPKKGGKAAAAKSAGGRESSGSMQSLPTASISNISWSELSTGDDTGGSLRSGGKRSSVISNSSLRSNNHLTGSRRLADDISDEFKSSILVEYAKRNQSSFSSGYMERLESLTVNKLRLSMDAIGRDDELRILQQCLDRLIPISSSSSTKVSTSASSSASSGSQLQEHLQEAAVTTEPPPPAATTADGGRELVFVRGLPGTGKSKLATTFVKKQMKHNKKMILAMGKFDLYLRDEPYSGVGDALSEIFAQVLADGERYELDKLRSSIQESMSHEVALFESIIPTLRSILQKTVPAGRSPKADSEYIDRTSSNDGVGDEQQNEETNVSNNVAMNSTNNAWKTKRDNEATKQMMNHAFRVLFRILSAHFAPLVVVFDDLQWSDQASLELIEILMNDEENEKLMIIACYRSEEVDNFQGQDGEFHSVIELQRRIEQSSSRRSSTTSIEINNLPLESVNEIICSLLNMDNEEETLELAKLCHERTAGNVFFLIQFLIMLKEEGLLTYQIGLMRWVFDVPKISRETAATANVVGMVADRMQKLPQGVHVLLQLGGLLGSEFRYHTIRVLWEEVSVSDGNGSIPSKRSGLQPIIEMAKDQNFIEEIEPEKYRWLHDKIQEAALSDISDERLQALRGEAGIALLHRLSPSNLDLDLFVVANLLRQCSPADDQEAATVAALFLQAAEKATSVSAYLSASVYAIKGIAYLPASCWASYPDIALRLYSIGTQACGYLGLVEKMWALGNVVYNQPSFSVQDKLPVYATYMLYLGNAGKPFDAVDLALDTLKQLGCTFPRNGAVRMMKTLSVLNKLKKTPPTEESLCALPVMTDTKTKAIIRVIFHLEPYFYYTKQLFLYALCAIKRVQLLLSHGMTDFSADAFFVVGHLLSIVTGDLESLVYWSRLSRTLKEISPGGFHESRVMYATTLAFAWRMPLHGLIKDFTRGYEAGMKVGDTEGAMWNCFYRSMYDVMAGKPLNGVVEKTRRHIPQMVELKKIEAATITVSIQKFVVELIGDPLTSLEEKIYAMVGTSESQHAAAPYGAKAWDNISLSLFRKYALAAELAIQNGNEFMKKFANIPMHMWDKFHQSLCLYAAAKVSIGRTKKNSRRRYLRHARKFKMVVDKWAKCGVINVVHQAALLEAEELASQCKIADARSAYEKAIGLATRGGFIHDAAVANERYAFFLQIDLWDKENADFYFSEALRQYRGWGADAVADGLSEARRVYCR